MASLESAIQKLYKEAQSDEFFVDSTESAIEVIRLGGKNDKLIEKDKAYWTFCKTQYENKPAIRMIFALREINKKVGNADKLTTIIKELENCLTFLDYCSVSKTEGFIYLDVIKIV